MIKRKWLLVFFCALLAFGSISYAENSVDSKNIVSIVYDDSGSMMDGSKYCYSDYALQILTASLSNKDELNIVKMTDAGYINEVDLTSDEKRQWYIDAIREIEHNGGTPFQAVDTAKDWLISKKQNYADDAKYWLIVITDGAFASLPPDVQSYMNKLNEQFNNLNFEFVLLNIGSSVGSELSFAVKNSANSMVVEAKDSNTIYSAMMEISKLINGGATDKFVKIEKQDGATVKLTSNYPLKSLMILTQNDDNKVSSVKYAGNNLSITSFDVSYETKKLKGNFTHVFSSGAKYLNEGEYIIDFQKNVNLKDVTFLCEAFIKAEISLVNENDIELNNAQRKILMTNDKIRVKCEIYNAATNAKIEDNNVIKSLDVNFVNGKNSYKMKYDQNKKAFYTEASLLNGDNNLYAIVEAKDLFRIKTNVIYIDTIAGKTNMEHYKQNQIVIEVPYSSSSEHKNVATYVFEFVEQSEINQAEEFELELIDFPKGVKIEYEGKQYDNLDKIPMICEIGKKYILNIMVNKNYVETTETEATLKIVSNNQIYWTNNGLDENYIKLVPKAYPLIVSNIDNRTSVDIAEEQLRLKLYRTNDGTAIQGEVNIKDIKKIEKESNYFNGITYSIEKDTDTNTLKVKFKANIFALFGKDNVDVDIKVELNNGIEIAEYKENISIYNIDILAILMPYIIAGVIIIIVLGYATKNKFNKKSQLTITEGSDRSNYTLKPTLKTLIIPFIAHKTKIGMIEFKAGKGSDIIYSGKGLTILKIDDENYEEYISANPINLEKIVMKKDMSSVTIDAFDSVQKYEYMTKEVEFSGYEDDTQFEDDYSEYSDYDDSQF